MSESNLSCGVLTILHREHTFVPPFFLMQTDLKRGLTTQVVEERRAVWGYNQLEEKKVNPFLLFLGYFWGPMPVSYQTRFRPLDSVHSALSSRFILTLRDSSIHSHPFPVYRL
jgi:hypothetical protein